MIIKHKIQLLFMILGLLTAINSHATQVRVKCETTWNCGGFHSFTYLKPSEGRHILIHEPNIDIQLYQHYRGVWFADRYMDITIPKGQDIVFNPGDESNCEILVNLQDEINPYITKKCGTR